MKMDNVIIVKGLIYDATDNLFVMRSDIVNNLGVEKETALSDNIDPLEHT